MQPKMYVFGNLCRLNTNKVPHVINFQHICDDSAMLYVYYFSMLLFYLLFVYYFSIFSRFQYLHF